MLPLLLLSLIRLGSLAPAAPTPEAPLVGGRLNSRALVVALHGGSWTAKTPPQLAERMRAELDGEARRAGLRLVVPVAPDSGEGEEWQVPWLTPAGEALVLRVISDEVEAGRVDPRRIHLAGHGAGATGALHLAARHPEIIAGVAAWSGAPSPVWDEKRRVIGLASDPVAGLRDVAVYLWTGTDDEHLDRAALALLVDGLRRQRDVPRSRPLLIESGEGGHGYGPGPRAGLRFLAEQRLGDARR
jgi:acetyl esterase/lipase